MLTVKDLIPTVNKINSYLKVIIYNKLKYVYIYMFYRMNKEIDHEQKNIIFNDGSVVFRKLKVILMDEAKTSIDLAWHYCGCVDSV